MSQGLKKQKNKIVVPFVEESMFDVPAPIAAWGKENDMEFKWLRYSRLTSNTIKSQWIPLNVKSANIVLDSFATGTRGDGLLVRDDLVLAYRATDLGDAYRAHIAKRRSAQNIKASQKGVTSEMKREAAQIGSGIKILEE